MLDRDMTEFWHKGGSCSYRDTGICDGARRVMIYTADLFGCYGTGDTESKAIDSMLEDA